MATPACVYVTGASGNTGSATIQALAKSFPAVKVVAQVRSLAKASEKFKSLPNVVISLKDVEVKDGKINEESVRALSTDMKNNGVTVCMVIPPGENRIPISLAYIKAAQNANVQFFVLLGVEASCNGVNTCLFARQFGEIEMEIARTGIPSCFLRCTFFMENHWGNVKSIKENSAFFYPVKGASQLHCISVVDIGKCAAAVIANPNAHKNRNYRLGGATITNNQIAAIYTRLLGKTVSFVTVPEAKAIEAMVGMGFPKWQSEGVVELWNFADAGQIPNEDDSPLLLNAPPTTFETWLTTGGLLSQLK